MSARSRPPGYRLADGAPATGWSPADPLRRTAAGTLDVALLLVTLGVGWAVWAWRLADRSTTPGKAALGLTVFATDTRRPAGRRRLLLRLAVYQAAALVIGLATLGLGWLYAVAGALGEHRRTIYDEWAQVVVLASPRS